jgi:hypothetical protein
MDTPKDAQRVAGLLSSGVSVPAKKRLSLTPNAVALWEFLVGATRFGIDRTRFDLIFAIR